MAKMSSGIEQDPLSSLERGNNVKAYRPTQHGPLKRFGKAVAVDTTDASQQQLKDQEESALAPPVQHQQHQRAAAAALQVFDPSNLAVDSKTGLFASAPPAQPAGKRLKRYTGMMTPRTQQPEQERRELQQIQQEEDRQAQLRQEQLLKQQQQQQQLEAQKLKQQKIQKPEEERQAQLKAEAERQAQLQQEQEQQQRAS